MMVSVDRQSWQNLEESKRRLKVSGHLPSVMGGVVNIPMFGYWGKAKEDFFWGVVMPEMGVTIPWVISYKQ